MACHVAIHNDYGGSKGTRTSYLSAHFLHSTFAMLFAVLPFLIAQVVLAAVPSVPNTQQSFDIASLKKNDTVKVPVVLGVMSRCPDALLCESVFDRVLKQVIDKVDLSLSFLGK